MMVFTSSSTAHRRWMLAALCAAVAMLLAAKGLGNEAYVSTHGDPPRYMMNAMFMLDLLRDRPFESLAALREYATLYYARYPALSLGHHPPLLSVLQVPFLALFGQSISAIRLPLILSSGAGALFLFLLVSDLYDEWAGTAAGLFLAASPTMVQLSQGAMSEPPAIALSVLAAYALHRFCATERRWPLVVWAVAAVLSVFAKQNAVVAFPAFALYACIRLGWRRLLKPDMLAAGLAVGVLAGSAIVATATISTVNVRRSTALIRVASGDPRRPESERRAVLRQTMERVSRALPVALDEQLTTTAAAVGLAGLVLMIVRRRPEAWLFGVWVATTLVFIILTTQRVEMIRYGVYWIPGLAASAGFLVWQARRLRLGAVIVAVALLMELSAAARVRVDGLGGYEEVARYVAAHPRGATVMFSGDIDTGFFIFFTRKFDQGRQQIVLRSDKIFTVSNMRQVAAEDLVDAPEQIGPTLRRLGVGYVVVEDQPSRSMVLEWLRGELRHGRYVERLRVPIATTDSRLNGTDLVVYEVMDVSAPQPDVRLDLRLPIISTELDVSLADLTARKHLR